MKENLPFGIVDLTLVKQVVKEINRCISQSSVTRGEVSFTINQPLSPGERKGVISKLRKQDPSMGKYFFDFLWRTFGGRSRHRSNYLRPAFVCA